MEVAMENKLEIDPEWWRPFFEGAFGQLQVGGIKDADAHQETDQLLACSGLSPGAKVLDAPTGAGRIAIELARRGFEVTGVDFNPNVIAKATATAAANQLPIDFRIADIRQLNFQAEFDAALSWWGSYGYFDAAGNAAYLDGLARSLRSGGKLVIDTQIAEVFYRIFAERRWAEWETDSETIRLLEQARFELETGRVITEWTILSRTGERRITSSIYVPTYRELVAQLRELGFAEFHAYNRFSGARFQLGSETRVCLVAIKS
jgi:SAM-dependent methyltransferase